MSHLCSELHRIMNELPRFHFPINDKLIPKNGIYIVFEKNENGHDADRIVRIGTHTGVNQLRSRLKQHFVHTNKDRSIFRKNIGRCILHRAADPYLKVWELDCTSSEGKAKHGPLVDATYQQEIELRVSEYIQQNFSFCVLEVPSKEERLYLESRIVSTVAACQECEPSVHWLGASSPVLKIRNSGLWQVNELYKEPLSSEDVVKIGGNVR